MVKRIYSKRNYISHEELTCILPKIKTIKIIYTYYKIRNCFKYTLWDKKIDYSLSSNLKLRIILGWYIFIYIVYRIYFYKKARP